MRDETAHFIDFQPVFEFDGPKPVGASVTKLPPLVISTLAQSAETLPSGEVIEERRWIVATVASSAENAWWRRN